MTVEAWVQQLIGANSAMMIATAVVVVVLGCLLALQRNRSSSKQWKKRLPPGPKPWPLLGNLPGMERLSHQGFANLSKTYGPLIHLWLGSVHLVVANSGESAKEILKTHDLIFASRPHLTQFVELAYDCQTLSMAPYGQVWRNLRKVLTVELLTARRLQQFQPVRTEEIRTALQALLEQSNGEKAVPVIIKIKEHMINIMTRMMMSKRFFGPKADGEADSVRFQTGLAAILDLLGVFHLGDYIPLFKRWDVQGHKKMMREAHPKMDRFLQDVLDERRRHHIETNESSGDNKNEFLEERGDFLDVLLTRSGQDDEVPLTGALIKGILQDAILGGVDSTASAVEWALAEVLKHPKVLQKAQEELDLVVGRETLVEESDIPKLHYLHAIVKENFRLHPVTPLLVPRVSSEACEMGGYHIPAGSLAYVNAWAIGRDPELWDNPLDFYPERFLDSPIDVIGHNFELLPFGSGRRKCPGITLGLLQVHYILAVLIQACQWSFPLGQSGEDIDMTEGCGLVNHMAVTVPAILTPRLPNHVIYADSVA